MRKTVRLLCLLLALVMCSGILVACGGDDDPDATTTKRPVGEFTNWDALDFSDTTLRIAYNEVINSSI